MEITKEKSISFKNVPAGPIIMVILIVALIYIGYAFYKQKVSQFVYTVTAPASPKIDFEFLTKGDFPTLESFTPYVDYTEDANLQPGKENPFSK